MFPSLANSWLFFQQDLASSLVCTAHSSFLDRWQLRSSLNSE